MNAAKYKDDMLVGLFAQETQQHAQELERIALGSQSAITLSRSAITELFRLTHAVRRLCNLMAYPNLEALTSQLNALVEYLKETPAAPYDVQEVLDAVFALVDLLTASAMAGTDIGEAECLRQIAALRAIKCAAKSGHLPRPGHAYRQYRANLKFAAESQMEHMQAYCVLRDVAEYADHVVSHPASLIADVDAREAIRRSGFVLTFESLLPYDEVFARLGRTDGLSGLSLRVEDGSGAAPPDLSESVRVPKAQLMELVALLEQAAGTEALSCAHALLEGARLQ